MLHFEPLMSFANGVRHMPSGGRITCVIKAAKGTA